MPNTAQGGGVLNLEYRQVYKVIRNDCRGFNNLSYTIHLR